MYEQITRGTFVLSRNSCQAHFECFRPKANCNQRVVFLFVMRGFDRKNGNELVDRYHFESYYTDTPLPSCTCLKISCFCQVCFGHSLTVTKPLPLTELQGCDPEMMLFKSTQRFLHFLTEKQVDVYLSSPSGVN